MNSVSIRITLSLKIYQKISTQFFQPVVNIESNKRPIQNPKRNLISPLTNRFIPVDSDPRVPFETVNSNGPSYLRSSTMATADLERAKIRKLILGLPLSLRVQNPYNIVAFHRGSRWDPSIRSIDRVVGQNVLFKSVCSKVGGVGKSSGLRGPIESFQLAAIDKVNKRIVSIYIIWELISISR